MTITIFLIEIENYLVLMFPNFGFFHNIVPHDDILINNMHFNLLDLH
jgi:hypothetical protein